MAKELSAVIARGNVAPLTAYVKETIYYVILNATAALLAAISELLILILPNIENIDFFVSFLNTRNNIILNFNNHHYYLVIVNNH